ncbi:IS30 family transposase [Chitinimonas lacunae]|uniref:IS30 family transposase n=1 Tax=Chitinimonas lacunae TaxID=1963018 RepID=A0ABV8MKJ3_9NEIS
MNSYRHFSQAERYQIEKGLGEGISQKAIAELLGRSASSVSREIKRNGGQPGYRAVTAQERSSQVKRTGSYIKESLWQDVVLKLKEDWSPEQISASLGRAISHEAIYQWIYANPENQLWRHLRRRQPRRRPWRRGVKRCILMNRRDISNRPAVVESRERVGDWEADTVIGAGQAGAILTLTERKTGLMLTYPLAKKTAEAVKIGMIHLLTPIREWVKTITSDNGTEFARHEQIAEALEADFFFAKPHSPWQRGSNENANGLLRQYFPKGSPLDKVREAEVHFAMQRLNTRPRKRFGYVAPLQQFEKLTGMTQVHHLIGIALRN